LQRKKIEMMTANKELKSSVKEDFTVTISGDVAAAIQRLYGKDDYSLIVENYFKFLLPKPIKKKSSMLALQLRGCAAASGLVNKTDKEIKEMMYREKYGI
jgi:hypothetical protein